METRINNFLKVKYGSGNGSGSGSGSGDGNGYGSGYGYGSGSGDGDGYGYGDGSGSGSGYGSSSSDGYGYGYGDGYGSGYGDGDGSGDGSGDGDGCKSISYKSKIYNVYFVDSLITIFFSIKDNIAKCAILNKDLSFTDCYIVKNDSFFAHGETIEKAFESLEEKTIMDLDVEKIIEKFKESFDNVSKYPVMLFFKWHNYLTGSCEFGRKSFAKNNNIDLENDEMTVSEFIDLTINSYGSNNIKLLKERIGL